MRTLIENYLPHYSSEVVKFRTDGECRFKIVITVVDSYHYNLNSDKNRNFNEKM